MNLVPPVPTDNLYKFLALSGLVLCIASVTGIQYRLNAVTARVSEFQVQIAEYGAEAAVYQTHAKQIHGVKAPSQPQLAALDSLDDRLHRLDAIIKVRSELIQQLMDTERGDDRLLFGGEVAGIVLAFAGFALWYERLQKYQDVAVRVQAGGVLAPDAKSRVDVSTADD